MSQQSQNVAAQMVASLQHDKINLQKQLTSFQLENQVLRRQLYHVSTLLDAAVSKLGSLGVVLDAPIDIRVLCAEADKHANTCAAQSQMDPGEAMGSKIEAPPQHFSKARFQLKAEFREHSKCVQCCAFSGSSDSLIVTGGLDCRLIVHDFLSLEKTWDVTAHSENICDVAWFEGTKNILSASYDASVKLWDPRKTEVSPLYQHNASGFVLSVVPLDKSFVFACADVKRYTSIVDMRANKSFSWEHPHRVNSLAYDSSVGHLITGHSNGTIAIWDIRMAGIVLSSSKSAAPGKDSFPGAEGLSHYQAKPQPVGGATTAAPPTPPAAGGGGDGGGGGGGGGAPPLHNTSLCWSDRDPVPRPTRPLETWANDASRAALSSLGAFFHTDGTRHLLCASDDNVVRVYRESLGGGGGGGSDLYRLCNVLPNVPARGFASRCGFWRGRKEKSQLPTFLEDEEKDAEMPVIRRVMEADLVVAGGPDNKATVFDVTEEGSAEVLEYLEGHRDRVTSAAVYKSSNYPIIATTSADSIVRIWVPAKT